MVKLIFSVLFLISFSLISAQVGISTDNSAPHSSAILDVKSATKAFYPPRMTTAQKNAIVNKQIGATVFDINVNALSYYDGANWVNSFPIPISKSISSASNLFEISNTGNGNAILGSTSSLYSNYGVKGVATATSPLNQTFGVYGENLSTSSLGYGVYGTHEGTGSAIKGTTTDGIAGDFFSNNGYALSTFGKLQFTGNNALSGRFLKAINSSGRAEWADLLPIDYTATSVNNILNVTNTSTGNVSAISGHTYSTGTGAAISGEVESSSGGIGVYGYNGGSGRAIWGYSNTGTAIQGYSASSGIGGLFSSQSGYALITTTGNVGIGTLTPAAKMDIKGTDNISHFYYGDNEDTYLRGGKASSEMIINDTGDKIGLGVAPNLLADEKVDINGRLRIRSGNSTSGVWFNNSTNSTSQANGGFAGMLNDNQMGFFIGSAWRFWVDNMGNGYLNGNLIQTSDKRLKKDFTQLNNSLSKIYQLNGCHFRWIEDARNKDLQTGFIAQEVQNIFPELVQTDDKGFLSVNYIGLIPHLIEAIKELKNENARLKTNQSNTEVRLQKLEQGFNATAKN